MTDQWDGWPEDDLSGGNTAGWDAGPGGYGDDADVGGYLTSDPAGVGGYDKDVDDEFVDGDGGSTGSDGRAALAYGDEPVDVGDGRAGFGVADDGMSEPVDDAVDGFGAAGDEPVDGFGVDLSDGGPTPGEGYDPPVGADPDVSDVDPVDSAPVFPEPLELTDLPEPVDGFPWVDGDVLGGGSDTPLPDLLAGVAGAPPLADLFAYAGEAPPAAGSGWSALMASPDPATSALARFWAAGG